jgi:phosphoinositide-3-kinase regulatory subunit 4
MIKTGNYEGKNIDIGDYLNHTLRAFFENIVTIGTFTGMKNLEQYLLPLILQSVHGKKQELSFSKLSSLDPENMVVAKVVAAFRSFVNLGTLDTPSIRKLCVKLTPLLMHPNPWIRLYLLNFFAAVEERTSAVDLYCFVLPILRPFLRTPLVKLLDAKPFLDSLCQPVRTALTSTTIKVS